MIVLKNNLIGQVEYVAEVSREDLLSNINKLETLLKEAKEDLEEFDRLTAMLQQQTQPEAPTPAPEVISEQVSQPVNEAPVLETPAPTPEPTPEPPVNPAPIVIQ